MTEYSRDEEETALDVFMEMAQYGADALEADRPFLEGIKAGLQHVVEAGYYAELSSRERDCLREMWTLPRTATMPGDDALDKAREFGRRRLSDWSPEDRERFARETIGTPLIPPDKWEAWLKEFGAG